MSYVPSHKTASDPIAQPVSLTVIEHTASTTQVPVVGNRVNIGTVHNWYNNFTPVISNNIFTLPSGYYYYLETNVHSYMINVFQDHMTISFQHYDETNSTSIGTLASNYGIYGNSADTFLHNRDECAKALIDCTSSSKNISIKITSNPQSYDRINYNSAQEYAGLGRTVIWQLES